MWWQLILVEKMISCARFHNRDPASCCNLFAVAVLHVDLTLNVQVTMCAQVAVQAPGSQWQLLPTPDQPPPPPRANQRRINNRGQVMWPIGIVCHEEAEASQTECTFTNFALT